MSKISNPKSTPEALSDKEMETYVKQVLVPIADKFVANHKGKEFTAIDIEGLYEDLNKWLCFFTLSCPIFLKFRRNDSVEAYLVRSFC